MPQKVDEYLNKSDTMPVRNQLQSIAFYDSTRKLMAYGHIFMG